MDEVFSETRVLILVMTYPHPSRGYQELVCTAGITENLEWVRLYPVDYRYRPKNQRFQKYQWVNINLASRGKGNDNRKESRKPDLESIRLIGEPLSRKNNWLERRLILEKFQSIRLISFASYMIRIKHPWELSAQNELSIW